MGKDKKILLALKDEDDFTEFATFLEKNGYRFIRADSGAKAMGLTLDDPPSLIIVDCQLPLIEGSHLFRILRNNPHTSGVPFLFISNRPLDIKGFKVGVDIFVTRPFLWEELHEQIKYSLSCSISARRMGDKEIQGKLSRVPLVDILQMLHMSRNEGELNLTRGDLQGVIYVHDGEIYNAACGKVEKEKALFRLLSWKDGIFEFRPFRLNVERKIESGTDHLLMEAMRQLDEMENSLDKFPDIDLRIGPDVDTSALPTGLKPVMYEVMKLVEYYPRVGDVIEHCSFTDYEVYSTIANLLERGILRKLTTELDESIGDSTNITPAQAIKIKEKVISNWSEMMLSSHGKVLILSSSPNLVKNFAHTLKFLPDFSLNSKSPIVRGSAESASVVGEIGSIKLYGNMEITLFSTPMAGRMGPFLTSFSSNVLGLIILWDRTDAEILSRLKTDKDVILSRRRVPVVHIYLGAEEPEETILEKYGKALQIKKEENSYDLSSSDNREVFEIFQRLLTDISGEKFVTSRVNSL